jgi:hypothetical protein
MIRNLLTVCTAVLLLAAGAARARAQMPTDNDTWKARCASLASQASDLNHLPATATAMTRGVAGSKFQTFAFDRQAAGQHQVACTLFFLAAVANQTGAGAKADGSAAQDSLLMANLEIKGMKGQSASFSEGFSRARIKAVEISRPSLTVADEEKIVLAATTIPFNTASASPRPVSFNKSQPAHMNH